MRAAAILTAYLFGLALFLGGYTPLWPWLLVSCLACAVWNARAAAVLAVAVLGLQIAKTIAPPDHAWLYYAAIYATLGFVSLAFIDKVAAATSFIVALIFIISLADLTEFVFIGGLIGAAYVGPSGGIFAGVLGSTGKIAGFSGTNRGGVFSGFMFRDRRLSLGHQKGNTLHSENSD